MTVRRSVIPDAIAELVDRWSTVLPDLQVSEGNLLISEADLLVVAWEDDDELSAVHLQRAQADYDGSQTAESFEVLCLLSTWIGDDDVRGQRTKLIDLLDQLDAALDVEFRRAVPGVTAVRVTEGDLGALTTDEGSVATLRFTVQIESWRT